MTSPVYARKVRNFDHPRCAEPFRDQSRENAEVEHRDGSRETKRAAMQTTVYSLRSPHQLLRAANRRYLEFLSGPRSSPATVATSSICSPSGPRARAVSIPGFKRRYSQNPSTLTSRLIGIGPQMTEVPPQLEMLCSFWVAVGEWFDQNGTAASKAKRASVKFTQTIDSLGRIERHEHRRCQERKSFDWFRSEPGDRHR